jgi:hypothetical protein
MTFFNKKEDVMKIELTPHGRNLLMKGELKPEFYAFFDDDILYDTQAAGFSEEGTEAKIRILTNTPSLKPQVTFTGVESKLNNADTSEDDNIFINPIGTNKGNSKKSNGWEATAIIGEFKSSTSYISSSTSPMYNIPQIECELNYTMSVGSIGSDSYISPDYDSSELAIDDTFVKLEDDGLLLYLLEKNGFSYKDSLSVEVFKYDPDELYFNKMYFETLDDVEIAVVDQIETNSELAGDSAGTSAEMAVETYFILERDSEISNSDLCKGIKKLKDKNIYLGLNIECEETVDSEVNIYQTLVTDIEDCE